MVLLATPARVAALDSALWACTDPDWLPHGTPATGDPDMQPIWLTDQDDAPNGASYAFLLDGMHTADLGRYARVFDLFDGQDADAVTAARARWSAAKAQGHALTYWQQGARGWEKKA